MVRGRERACLCEVCILLVRFGAYVKARPLALRSESDVTMHMRAFLRLVCIMHTIHSHQQPATCETPHAHKARTRTLLHP